MKKELFGEVSLLVNKGNSLPQMQAAALFEAGVLLMDVKDREQMEMFAKGMGIRVTVLMGARGIARHYKGDKEKFMQDFINSGYKSFDEFRKRHEKPDVNKRRAGMVKAMEVNRNITASVIDEVRAYRENPTQERFELLSYIHRKIGTILPADAAIIDRNYIKYHRCAACGDPAEPEGHRLMKREDLPGVLIPLCDRCMEEKRPVNMGLLAVMYARYALNMERSFNKIRYEEG